MGLKTNVRVPFVCRKNVLYITMMLYVIIVLNAYILLHQGFQNPTLRLELGQRIPKIIKGTLFRKKKLDEIEQLHPQMFPQIFSLIFYYKSTAIY
jgi:hypothetical protein